MDMDKLMWTLFEKENLAEINEIENVVFPMLNNTVTLKFYLID